MSSRSLKEWVAQRCRVLASYVVTKHQLTHTLTDIGLEYTVHPSVSVAVSRQTLNKVYKMTGYRLNGSTYGESSILMSYSWIWENTQGCTFWSDRKIDRWQDLCRFVCHFVKASCRDIEVSSLSLSIERCRARLGSACSPDTRGK